MLLKQNGSEVSGSGGPSEARQREFDRGRLEGKQVVLEQDHQTGRTPVLALTVDGDRMSGEMKHSGEQAASRVELEREE